MGSSLTAQRFRLAEFNSHHKPMLCARASFLFPVNVADTFHEWSFQC
jgi:hypothetical protein